MTKISPRVSVLLGVCLLQLLVPASMIGKREATLNAGSPYLFKTRPVDPHDPFRGRYVALDFEESSVRLEGGSVERGSELYAEVYKGDDGFAKLGKAGRERPESGDYIKVRARYYAGEGRELTVDLPFDRYYMNEKKAPAAERAYWDNNRQTNRNTYAVVKVLNGMSVIEALYIDGQHVLDHLDKESGK